MASCVNAVTLIGTLLRLSSLRVAVTTISCSGPTVSSAAAASARTHVGIQTARAPQSAPTGLIQLLLRPRMMHPHLLFERRTLVRRANPCAGTITARGPKGNSGDFYGIMAFMSANADRPRAKSLNP